MENKAMQVNEKLLAEVKVLAQSHGWPELRLSRFWPTFIGGFVMGLFIGLGILFLLTRGQFEGVVDLLKGGGSGVGLIIVAVTTCIGTVAGLGKALKTTSGEKEWAAWLSQRTLGDNVLLWAKALLERKP